MALVTVGEGGSGDFLPIIKYDARSGRFFRVDKSDGVSTAIDITRAFKAVFDLEQVEVGYIHFPVAAAPNFCLVPFGQSIPAKPSADHKPGVRLHVKLSKDCGGDVRELAQTAGAFLKGINALHDEYLKQAPANAGKLPIVTISPDPVAIATKTQKGTTTNYQPVFGIAGWAARPADMPLVGKDVAPVATNGAAKPAAVVASPPVAKPATDDDFGDPVPY